MLTKPAVCEGVTQVMLEEETTTTDVAALPPNVTPVAPVKLVPDRVTAVPPAKAPPEGEHPVTVGAGKLAERKAVAQHPQGLPPCPPKAVLTVPDGSFKMY